MTAGEPDGTIGCMHRATRRTTASQSVKGIAARLRPFLRERNVLKAIVFGSWARGTNTRRSDLDLAVITTERAFLDRRKKLRGIEAVLDGLHTESPDTYRALRDLSDSASDLDQ